MFLKQWQVCETAMYERSVTCNDMWGGYVGSRDEELKQPYVMGFVVWVVVLNHKQYIIKAMTHGTGLHLVLNKTNTPNNNYTLLKYISLAIIYIV